MKTYVMDQELAYDGSQLRSLFGYLELGVQGDSIVSFQGPCLIPEDKIVDGEDLRAGEKICGDLMCHFIIEIFHRDLAFGVLAQRLLVVCLKEVLEDLQPDLIGRIDRQGDDLFVDGGKLNISIATSSPNSVMIHVGVNIVNDRTPVKTSALEDFSIDPMAFRKALLEKWSNEYLDSLAATTKVKSVP